MLAISIIGLFVGSIHSKHVHLFWIAIGSLVVMFWVGALHYAMGHSTLHTLREGVYSAWSMEIGLLAGLLLDRLVLHRKAHRWR
jgi:polyferredoxin